jgi:hypothetical protein
VYLWLFTGVAFTWYVVLGSIVTFLVGYGASSVMGRTSAPRQSFQPLQGG